ncbi:MAG: hypothetical protein DME25_13085 [Verrucomicrobia bacterium]|nr:MAG: hypothetical protein DME25_13085 [Verrucomicrobiota bacterium]
MEIKTNITKADLVEFRLYNQLRNRKAKLRRLALAWGPPAGLVGAVLALQTCFGPGPLEIAGLIVSALVLGIYPASFFYLTRKRLAREVEQTLKADPSSGSALLGEHLVVLSEGGVKVVVEEETAPERTAPEAREAGASTAGRAEPAHWRWGQIPNVEATGDYGYIYTAPGKAIIVPRRCFPAGEVFDQFVKSAIIYHWKRDHAPITQPEEQAASSDASASDRPIRMGSALGSSAAAGGKSC